MKMSTSKYTETVVEMTSVFWQMVVKKEIEILKEGNLNE